MHTTLGGAVMCNALAPRIAIFDADAGMLDLYRELADDAGSRIVLHADAALLDVDGARRLLREGDPQAVIWAIAPPYTEGVAVLRDLLARHDLDRRALIVTTTVSLSVDGLLHDTPAIVLGKPFDIEQLSALIGHGLPRGGSP